MKIINRHKPKPSRELKFPIGIEIIYKNFENLVSEKDILINFILQPESKIRNEAPYSFGSSIKLKNVTNYEVEFNKLLVINFSLIEQSWKLNVYSTKTANASKCKDFITKIGLDICKDWISKPKNETWFEGQRFLQIGLNEDFNKYTILETHNEYIVNQSTRFY